MADVMLTAPEREVMWTKFLERWPLESLDSMALVDYTQSGNKDVFQNWLEIQTEALGSIWGGSAFKFGIYSRDSKADRENGGGKSYATDYAWYSKYGDTTEAAWTTVRSIVAGVAKAARIGDWQAIEQADLGTVVKWKIAFLYQDRANASILPMYSPERLQWLSGQPGKLSPSELHKALMMQREEQGLFEYVDALQQRWDAHAANQLTSEQALAWLKAQESLSLIKDPTDKMAGFQDSEGRQLGLLVQNKTPTLFVGDGDWLTAGVQAQLAQLQVKIERYQEDASRNSNLQANAPALWIGHKAVRLNGISTLGRLEAVVQHYAAGDGAVDAPVFLQAAVKESVLMNTAPLNQILFGPPGTGKTYSTVTKALEILDPQLLVQVSADTTLGQDEKRKRLKLRFDELVNDEKRIRFTTFHQSFSYEDFVEGIRAVVDDGDEGSTPRFVIEKGVFAQLCEAALQNREQDEALGVRDGAAVWKVSIGELSGNSDTRDYCFAHDEMRVGWPQAGDLSTEEYLSNSSFSHHNKNALWAFSEGAQVGDIVLCFAGNSRISAVGVVSGDYRYEPDVPAEVRKDFVQVRPVHWLLKNIDFSVKELNGNKALVQQTMYELHRITWPRLQEALVAKGYALSGAAIKPNAPALPYVLVIDEINRGNVSRIFGELITLLESSKRAGAAEALSVTLPYSKQSFSVPGNVYIIGTMNTTDRSLAGLDVALRRRFDFEELMPEPKTLRDVVVREAGVSVDVERLLTVMNERIEALLDREHQLGHAYFMPLREIPTREMLAQIFKNRVLPLLQEYFFDDWERIAWVLNDHRKPQAHAFVQKHGKSLDELFGAANGVQAMDKRWRINPVAFESLKSFAQVIEVGQVVIATEASGAASALVGSSN